MNKGLEIHFTPDGNMCLDSYGRPYNGSISKSNYVMDQDLKITDYDRKHFVCEGMNDKKTYYISIRYLFHAMEFARGKTLKGPFYFTRQGTKQSVKRLTRDEHEQFLQGTL